MSAETTHSLRTAHEAMRATLKRAMREPGRLGETAREVAVLADGHFLREEKFVVPLLALLPDLARGEPGPHFSQAIKLVKALKPELAQLTAEHRALAEALRELMAAAVEAGGKPEYVQLAEELLLHNRMEEQALYPAAIVAGDYVKLLHGEP